MPALLSRDNASSIGTLRYDGFIVLSFLGFNDFSAYSSPVRRRWCIMMSSFLARATMAMLCPLDDLSLR